MKRFADELAKLHNVPDKDIRRLHTVVALFINEKLGALFREKCRAPSGGFSEAFQARLAQEPGVNGIDLALKVIGEDGFAEFFAKHAEEVMDNFNVVPYTADITTRKVWRAVG